MTAPLHILHLEDTPQDAELIAAELERGGFATVITRVENRAAFVAALERGGFDLVLLDFNLPAFDGLSALDLALQRWPDTPVIFVSGTIGEDLAVETVKRGGRDYVLKHQLPRLPMAVHRALKEVSNQRERERAESASRAKSDFLANMSHELRTPLSVIIGFAQVLDEKLFGELGPEQAEYVKDILISARHLLSLINDILDLAKIEAGKMELQPAPVPLSPLLTNSLLMIREKCLRRGIQIAIEQSGALEGLSITADERMLKQILFNLLSNAAKFTPQGGTITLRADADSQQVQVSVTDTGIGIAREHQARIFEEFFQIRGSTTDVTPGTGLGLSLVKRFVELHGGRVWLTSEGPGTGCTFAFTLPRHPQRPGKPP